MKKTYPINPLIHQGVTVQHNNGIMARVLRVDKTINPPRLYVQLLQNGKLTAHEQQFTEEHIASVFVVYKHRNDYYLQYDYHGLFADVGAVRSKTNDTIHSACYAGMTNACVPHYPNYILDYIAENYEMLMATDNYKHIKEQK